MTRTHRSFARCCRTSGVPVSLLVLAACSSPGGGKGVGPREFSGAVRDWASDGSTPALRDGASASGRGAPSADDSSSDDSASNGEGPNDDLSLSEGSPGGESGRSAGDEAGDEVATEGGDDSSEGDAVVSDPPEVPGSSFPAVGSVEDGGAECPVPPLVPFNQLPAIEALPDPFVSMDGTRITSRAEWRCRRSEIGAQVQEYELGPKPARPSIVTGQMLGNQLQVTAGEPGNTVNFSVTLDRPGNAQGAAPALIEIGGSSLDNGVFSERGVVRINFDNGQMGAQAGGNSRGNGVFYDLYGPNHGAGSMMAWAWGVSRVIDALEQVPEAGVDLRRLAVTGCSRNGKGALVVGAFDERIALTIPQESGAGGSASWRVSQIQQNAILAVNPGATVDDQVQTLVAAQGEQPWFRANFGQFSNAVTRLPFDHHMLMGMVAPRSLFVVDNTSMNWLGNESSFTDAVAAAEIWTALGVSERMGASQVGDHDHCVFPASQRAELVAFVDKFLVGGGTGNTNVLRSDQITPDRARWMPWTTPTLE